MATDPSIDEFHSARSKFLDAFAVLETHVVRLLIKNGLEPSCLSLGFKIEALRKAKPGPQYAKAAKAAVEAVLDGLSDLLKIRADIVHAELIVVTIDGERRAMFRNALSVASPAPAYRGVSADGFRTLTQQVRKLGEGLAKY